MWLVIVVFLLVATSAAGQTTQSLLLPEAVHITGTVVDQEGKPIVAARIEHHSSDLRTLRETDALRRTDPEGRFAFDTHAPSVVVRKAGFRSVFLQTSNAKGVRIILQASPSRLFPICRSTSKFDSIQKGWGASFWFPKLPGVNASGQLQDIDYGQRNYFVKTKDGPKGIRHGSGALWSYGFPSDFDVWQSAEYEETAFEDGRILIVDARGRFPNGNRWRYLGKFGESADYSNVDEATAKILDQVLDGACVKSKNRK